jgi:hypothetical protein
MDRVDPAAESFAWDHFACAAAAVVASAGMAHWTQRKYRVAVTVPDIEPDGFRRIGGVPSRCGWE